MIASGSCEAVFSGMGTQRVHRWFYTSSDESMVRLFRKPWKARTWCVFRGILATEEASDLKNEPF